MESGENRNIQEETESLNEKEKQEVKENLPQDDVNESVAGKGKKRHWPKIVSALVAVVIITAIIFGIFMNSASANLNVAVKNTMKAAASSAPVALLKSVFTQGSMELALDLESISDQLYGVNIEGQLSAKYISNLKNSQMALILALADGRNPIADAVLHKSKDAIVLESDILFGNTAYGIGLNDFSGNLESSIFNPDNDSYYALDYDLYEFLTEMDMDGNTEKYSEYKKIADTTADEALDTFYKSIIKNFEIEKSKDTIEFVDTKSKVTVLSVYGDSEMISAVIKEMFEWMESSRNVELLLEQTVDLYGPILEETGGDPDDFVDNFYEGISLALEDFDELVDLLEEDEIEVNAKFYITRKGRELVKVDFEASSFVETHGVVVTAGPSLRDVELISVEYTKTADWLEFPEKYSFTYTVDENDANFYSAQLRVRESYYGDTIRSKASVTWDKKDGDLRIKADDLFTLKGTMLYDKDVLTIDVQSIGNEWESIRPGLSITLNKNESTPSVPDFKDILSMDEDEFEDLGEEISWNVMDFMDEISDTADWLYDLFYYLF